MQPLLVVSAQLCGPAPQDLITTTIEARRQGLGSLRATNKQLYQHELPISKGRSTSHLAQSLATGCELLSPYIQADDRFRVASHISDAGAVKHNRSQPHRRQDSAPTRHFAAHKVVSEVPKQHIDGLIHF